MAHYGKMFPPALFRDGRYETEEKMFVYKKNKNSSFLLLIGNCFLIKIHKK
jgi:hypothetical protein